MPSDNSSDRSRSGQSGTLGVCWIIYGIIRLAAAVGMILYAGTATLMFGALLNRVADPFSLMDVFHILYIAAIVLGFICGILGLIAGFGLLSGARSARGLAITAGLLSLSGIPLGLMLGVYTLVVLVPRRES
jgi:hypothetical protein